MSRDGERGKGRIHRSGGPQGQMGVGALGDNPNICSS